MFLKNYQQKVVNKLKFFYSKARKTKDAFNTASKSLPENMRHTLNWVQTTFQNTDKEYKDRCTNGLGEYYPRIVMKVPTGGGKTLLAVESIREYQNIFTRKRKYSIKTPFVGSLSSSSFGVSLLISSNSFASFEV